MKKLTRLFSIVLVIAMLVMCMAGCGDKKETAGSDQNPTAGGDASTCLLYTSPYWACSWEMVSAKLGAAAVSAARPGGASSRQHSSRQSQRSVFFMGKRSFPV